MKAFLIPAVVTVIVGVLAGFVSIKAQGSVKPEPWPIEVSEQLQLEGINARYQAMQDAIAQVVTDAQTRQAILQFLTPRIQAAGQAERLLVESVHTRLHVPGDVALVVSGNTWIRKP